MNKILKFWQRVFVSSLLIVVLGGSGGTCALAESGLKIVRTMVFAGEGDPFNYDDYPPMTEKEADTPVWEIKRRDNGNLFQVELCFMLESVKKQEVRIWLDLPEELTVGKSVGHEGGYDNMGEAAGSGNINGDTFEVDDSTYAIDYYLNVADNLPKEKTVTIKATITPEDGPAQVRYTKVKIPKGKAASEKRTGVIVIPGIAGSELYYGDKLAWVNNEISFNEESLFGLSKDAAYLKCNSNGSSLYPIKSGRGGTFVKYPANQKKWGAMDCVGALMKSISDEGYNVYLFSYDWRMDTRSAALELERIIDMNFDEVRLVCHSMGGIVASQYLLKEKNRQKVYQLITLGTPYLGSVKIPHVLETGGFLTGGLGIGADAISFLTAFKSFDSLLKRLAKDFNAVYQLLPTERYVDKSPYVKLGYKTRTYIKNSRYQRLPSKNYVFRNEYLDYKNTTAFQKVYGNEGENNKTMIDVAGPFQEEVWKDNRHITSQVETYYIVGYGQATQSRTLYAVNRLLPENAGVDIENAGGAYNYAKKKGYGFEYYGTTPGTGDGTVPLSSATMQGTTPANRTYYVNAGHSELTKDKGAIQTVLNILKAGKGANVTPGEGVSKTYPKSKDKWYGKSLADSNSVKYTTITLACPIDVEVYDGDTLIASIEKDWVTYCDPTAAGAEANLHGEDRKKQITLPGDSKYEVIITGTGEGTMDYEIADYENGEIQTLHVYEDVPISKGMIIRTSTEERDALNIDQDGDGTVDDEIEVDAVYSMQKEFNVIVEESEKYTIEISSDKAKMGDVVYAKAKTANGTEIDPSLMLYAILDENGELVSDYIPMELGAFEMPHADVIIKCDAVPTDELPMTGDDTSFILASVALAMSGLMMVAILTEKKRRSCKR